MLKLFVEKRFKNYENIDRVIKVFIIPTSIGGKFSVVGFNPPLKEDVFRLVEVEKRIESIVDGIGFTPLIEDKRKELERNEKFF